MRRCLSVIVALLLALAAGCSGGSDEPEPGSGGAGPSGSATPPAEADEAPTEDEVLAAGRSINLRPEDLPGFTGTPPSPDDADPAAAAAAAELSECLGVPGLIDDGEEPSVESDDFASSDGLPSITWSSSVSYDEEADNAAGLAALASPEAPGCIQPFVQGAFGGAAEEGVTLGEVQVEAVEVDPGSAQGGTGFRAVTSLSSQGVDVPFVVDIVFLYDRTTTVGLFGAGLAIDLPVEQRDALVTALTERMTGNTEAVADAGGGAGQPA